MKYLSFVWIAFSLLVLSCTPTSNAGNKANNTTQTSEKELNPRIADYLKTNGKDYSAYEVATFAGGCFWCTEAAFERIEGVIDVISGYSGGASEHPTYAQIGSRTTGHAEAIQIYYDPKIVDFNTLLKVLYVAHDGTQVNRQGNDVGPQYRSAVFYHNDAQKTATKTYIKKLNEQLSPQKIATEVAAYTEFWVAEAYHQDYYEHHPENPYVQNVSRVKVEKVKKKFAHLLKAKYK